MKFEPPVPFVVALLPSYQARVERTPLVFGTGATGPKGATFFRLRRGGRDFRDFGGTAKSGHWPACIEEWWHVMVGWLTMVDGRWWLIMLMNKMVRGERMMKNKMTRVRVRRMRMMSKGWWWWWWWWWRGGRRMTSNDYWPMTSTDILSTNDIQHLPVGGKFWEVKHTTGMPRTSPLKLGYPRGFSLGGVPMDGSPVKMAAKSLFWIES